MTAVSALLGAGGVIKGEPSPAILYFVPFIALAFDLFIIGQSFAMRRMAKFVEDSKDETPDAEWKWQNFVRENEDPVSRIANFGVTFITGSCAAVILAFSDGADSAGSWIRNLFNLSWVLASLILFVSLFVADRRIRDKLG